MGLSICKQIIAKMDGGVSVKSEVGEGTTFKISLAILCKGNRSLSYQSQKFSSEYVINPSFKSFIPRSSKKRLDTCSNEH